MSSEDRPIARGVIPPRLDVEVLRAVLRLQCAACGKPLDVTHGVVATLMWPARTWEKLHDSQPRAVTGGAEDLHARVVVAHAACAAGQVAEVGDTDGAADIVRELVPQGGPVRG